ncbi:MAG: hypothetical protein R3253_00010 [Longimicrobiales bacterium]|nr:hypothetical protein [Longimicrobiales bacterium]
MKPIRYAVLSTVVLMGSAGCEQVEPNSWVVLPGERVGPVSHTSDEDELVETFGAEAVRPIQIYVGESSVVPGAPGALADDPMISGTEILPDSPDRVEILWWHPGERRCPYAAVFRETGSRWETGAGVRVGIGAEELERLNGSPFTFAGFEWDGSGEIRSWEGGLLETSHEIGIDFFGALTIRNVNDVSNRELMSLSGSRSLRSDSPIVRRLDLELAVMGVLWSTAAAECSEEDREDGR